MTNLLAPSGAVLTQGLFVEMSQANKEDAPYTLKDQDIVRKGITHLSLKKLYLASTLDDPTEYHFISTYLYSLDHWDKLCDCNFFIPHLDIWRRTKDMRMKAEMLQIIRTEARSESGKNKYGAAKTILDSLEKKEKNAKEDSAPKQVQDDPYNKDYERLMNDQDSTGTS